MTDSYKYHGLMSIQHFSLATLRIAGYHLRPVLTIATLWSIGLCNKVVPYACDKTLILRSVATLGIILVLIIVQLRPVLISVIF